ncbi:VOC family protein [Microbacterium sp. zg.Y625]|uniref:VOC family protein n=1 Tax=Microbacterium jiangjiandongii TaxID=3049071 RepID=UPI00214B7CB4|nr:MULTISPECIES: VOC family protein [unclassified Microbacterium]MCR2791970.1 VOC family protein [Microbacterium sp. zg.Y625]MCR2815206.1 VOC family protein [Microbacterium sp. zg.Y843]WIM24781.1 VOC family protein [Microbacterium sp. zg-Y625]
MFRGLANLNLVSDDMDAAIDWYSTVLGSPPYFTRPEQGPPQYAEWRFGDDEDELALMDAAFRPVQPAPGGAVVSMHVDDIHDSVDRLLELGATTFEPVTQRGEGWWSATIADPFGNLIGLIHSPHWAGKHAP